MKKISQKVALATLALLVAGILLYFVVQKTRNAFAEYREQIPAAVTENPN